MHKILKMSIASQYQQHIKYVERFNNFSAYILHQSNELSKEIEAFAEEGCELVENKSDEEKRLYLRQMQDVHFFCSFCMPFIMIWIYITLNRRDDLLEELFGEKANDTTYIPDIDELFSVLMAFDVPVRDKIINRLPYKEFNRIKIALDSNDKQAFASMVNNSSFDFRTFAGVVRRFANFYEIYTLLLNLENGGEETKPYLWYITEQMTKSTNPSVSKIGKSIFMVSEMSSHVANEKDFVLFLESFSSYVQELNKLAYRIISEYNENPTTDYIEEEIKVLNLVLEDMPVWENNTKEKTPAEKVKEKTEDAYSVPAKNCIIGRCPLTKDQLARLANELSQTLPPYIDSKDKNSFMYVFNGEYINTPNFDSVIKWYGSTASLKYLLTKVWNLNLPSGYAKKITERFTFYTKSKFSPITADTFLSDSKYIKRLVKEKEKGGIDHIKKIDEIMNKIKTHT